MTALDPAAVALLVTRALDELGIPHTIGGSIASSFAGEPRSTLDVDIIAAIQAEHVDSLVAALSSAFYIEGASLRRAIRATSSTNLIHQDTQIKIDLFVAGGTPLDHQQISRRTAVELGPGRTLYIHPPEDILLQKLHWYHKGGAVSDRQWRDVLGIVRVQGARLDTAYLREQAPTLGVEALLERALGEGGPTRS
jgi:hypothetical protein